VFGLLAVRPFSLVNARRKPITPIAQSATSAQGFATLLAKAQTTGSVRIIVMLRVAFRPEGLLANTLDALVQRGAIAQAQQALLANSNGIDQASIKRFTYTPALAVSVNAAALARLNASPLVSRLEEDRKHFASLAESVPLIGAPAAWASGYTGAGQAVAILDTGVDKTHSFLAGKVVSEACFSSTIAGSAGTTSVCPGGLQQTTATGSGVPCTVAGCDHGTHVAGIAAGTSATFSGVAKNARVIAIQVFSKENTCAPSSACVSAWTSDIIFGLERVLTLRSSFNIAAVNLSLGGGQSSSNCDTSPLKPTIDNLSSFGIATVIASGNNGFTNALSEPACISTAISVGSTGDGSTFNSVTATLDVVSSFSNNASFLNLLAPGEWINSSVPGGGFANFAGTSMAAPHVTGAWAVLKSKIPNATVTQVLNALSSTGLSVTDSRNGLTKPRIRVDQAANALTAAPVIAAAPPATITAENCSTPNNALDPGETVTVSLPLQNIGSSATNNLTATLQASGGVTSPSAQQSYGALSVGGAAVSHSFTFTVDAALLCGNVITAALQLQDGATNLGTVSFTLQIGVAQANAVTSTYSYTGSTVDIPDGNIVEVPITVPDFGVVSDVNVRLRLDHPYISDLGVYLIGPDGTVVELSSDNGDDGDNYGTGANDCTGTFTVFDDAAATSITAGTPPFAGTFRPEGALSAFNGKSLNGTWKLRFYDDLAPDTGLLGCWQLEVTRQTFTCCTLALAINNVIQPAGRAEGAQQIKLAGSFANLSSVTMGGNSATWFYTNGASDTSMITVITPSHAVGAVDIVLTPLSGISYTKPNAFAYLPTSFTDDPLVAGVTTAKAQHIIELRQAVDALRAVAGLGAAPWTDPTLSPTNTLINAVHILELRTNLESVAALLGHPVVTYTDPTLTNVVIKLVHMEELRQRIRDIAG
jgi:subtilisin family serine protease/subtilisin-like proprotein convertase family protein